MWVVVLSCRYEGGAALYLTYDGRCTDLSVGNKVFIAMQAPKGASTINALTTVIQVLH